ncbi:hypothetical protein PMIN01_06064 [Paraphaeosphaeria minitans]|uniref:Uncharacterized protein n=1 Tax=Paraphaeosphaeria minitans TaxID=565426 RepID=A0A9P6KRZ5_9PLEO|nr:hypothetical protein PMIN01_06064 [Paraphaeosphaeria minitans]
MLSSLDGSTTRQKMTVQRPDPPTVGRHVPTVYLDTARYCAGPHVATPLRSEAGRELAARTHVVDHGQSTSALWEAARSQAVSNAHDGFAELAPGLIDPLHTFLPLRLLFYLCLHGLPTRALTQLSLSNRSFLPRVHLHSHSFRVLASPTPPPQKTSLVHRLPLSHALFLPFPTLSSSSFPHSLLALHPPPPARILGSVCVLARLGRQPFCLSFAAP